MPREKPEAVRLSRQLCCRMTAREAEAVLDLAHMDRRDPAWMLRRLVRFGLGPCIEDYRTRGVPLPASVQDVFADIVAAGRPSGDALGNQASR